MKAKSIAFPGLVLLLVPITALAQQVQGATTQTPPAWYGGPWQMWHGDWSFWWIFPLLMFFMMIACAFMIVRAIRSGAGIHCGWGHARHPSSSESSDPAASALRLLNERFARGEIEQREYEEKRAALGRRPAGQRS